MLIKSVYDLIRAFVVAAGNHLITAVTVENQHVNHPCPSSRTPDPICKSPSLGSRTNQNNPLNSVCLDIRRHSIDTSTASCVEGREKRSGQPASPAPATKKFVRTGLKCDILTQLNGL